MIPRERFTGWNSGGEGEGEERNPPWTFREKTLALQAEQKSAVRFPSYIMLLYLNRAATFRKQWFVFIFILSNLILPPDTSPKWRRGRKKRKLKRVISFLTVHFFVSTAGQEAEIHLCLHVQFYSLRNKVDVQSLGDCQHWICFRLSCRVG